MNFKEYINYEEFENKKLKEENNRLKELLRKQEFYSIIEFYRF